MILRKHEIFMGLAYKILLTLHWRDDIDSTLSVSILIFLC